MQTLPVNLVWALSAAAAFIVGALAAYLFSRRAVHQAHDDGSESRAAEVATLTEQRDAASEQIGRLDARLARYERDWASAEQNLRDLSARAAVQQAQAERLAVDLAESKRNRDDAQSRLVELTRTHAALEAGAREQAQAAAEKLRLLEHAELRLRESFQNLANQILDDKAERFREQSSQQLGGLLDPFKVKLQEFRESVEQRHANDQRERGMLMQELSSMRQLNQRLSDDATNLTRALKGDKGTQGAWGEMVLESVLEASGLQAGREYTRQTSFSDADGGRQRPDVIVHLPDDKDIVIDAKVSLLAYERACSAPDDATRTRSLAEHAASLKRHIDGLSLKNYADIDGVRTLDFVLLFVPIEAAYIEAVRADDRLYNHALAKNIALASPSTLMATLRTVSHLWRIQDRHRNALEIAECGARLHDNFVSLVGELAALGGQLDKAQAAHSSALRRLTDGGKGSVVLQVKRLAEMGVPARKSLPPDLLDAAGADSADNGSGDADRSLRLSSPD